MRNGQSNKDRIIEKDKKYLKGSFWVDYRQTVMRQKIKSGNPTDGCSWRRRRWWQNGKIWNMLFYKWISTPPSSPFLRDFFSLNQSRKQKSEKKEQIHLITGSWNLEMHVIFIYLFIFFWLQQIIIHNRSSTKWIVLRGEGWSFLFYSFGLCFGRATWVGYIS